MAETIGRRCGSGAHFGHVVVRTLLATMLLALPVAAQDALRFPFEPTRAGQRVAHIRSLIDRAPVRAAAMLQNRYPTVRDAAARAWLDLGPGDAVAERAAPSLTALLRDLDDRDLTKRARAAAWLRLVGIRSASRMDRADARGRLTERAKAESPAVRATALRALATDDAATPATARVLLDALKDRASVVRVAALEALTALDMPDAETASQKRVALWRALDARDPALAIQAAISLCADGEARGLLARRLRHETRHAVQTAIVRRLGRTLSPTDAEHAAMQVDPGIQAAALLALDDRHPHADRIAARALDAREALVRRHAIGLFARLQPLCADRIARIADAASDQNADVRHAALTLLAQLDEPLEPAVDAIADALAHADPVTRRLAVAAAARAGPAPALVKGIESLLRSDDGDHTVGLDAIRHWGNRAPKTIDALIDRLVRATRQTERRSIIDAIARLGATAAPALIESLRDADAGPHQSLIDALVALGQAGARALADSLAPLRGRQRLLAALGQLGYAARRAAPAIAAYLDAADADTRLTAAMALGEIGPAAIPAVARVWRASRRRDNASWALLRIAELHGPAAAAAQPIFLELLLQQKEARAELGAAGLQCVADEPAGPLLYIRQRLRGERELAALIDATLARRDTVRAEDLAAWQPWLAAPRACHRTIASLALATIGEPAVAPLERALSSRSVHTREAAARALAQIAHDDASAVVRVIHDTYGVRVEMRGRTYDLPRALWTTAHMRPLNRQARGLALGQLAVALSKYPPAVPRLHADTIYLLQDLSINRMQYGGTFYDSAVYVAAGRVPNHFVQEAFHHEFSSLLLARHPLSTAWKDCNPPSHRYRQGGREAIMAGLTGWGTTSLYRDGFFKPYALADAENDFNVFSETVLAHPILARQLIERHPRLAEKWHVWIDYYRSIDPAFDESAGTGIR